MSSVSFVVSLGTVHLEATAETVGSGEEVKSLWQPSCLALKRLWLALVGPFHLSFSQAVLENTNLIV